MTHPTPDPEHEDPRVDEAVGEFVRQCREDAERRVWPLDMRLPLSGGN